MVIGWPSPAACSPTLASRSTGPQPLVADSHCTSLTWSWPAGGSGGTDPTIRSSLKLRRLASCVIVAVAVIGLALASVAPAVTVKVTDADWPSMSLSIDAGLGALAVQP